MVDPLQKNRLRIISDGTPHGTKVLDGDGNPVPGLITKVEWSIKADSTAGQARITFDLVEIDAIGESKDG